MKYLKKGEGLERICEWIRHGLTDKQIPPSAILSIFLAKNRMRDKYRDYAPTLSEAEGTGDPLDVKIYLPDNGRGMNDSQTAGRISGEVFVN